MLLKVDYGGCLRMLLRVVVTWLLVHLVQFIGAERQRLHQILCVVVELLHLDQLDLLSPHLVQGLVIVRCILVNLRLVLAQKHVSTVFQGSTILEG